MEIADSAKCGEMLMTKFFYRTLVKRRRSVSLKKKLALLELRARLVFYVALIKAEISIAIIQSSVLGSSDKMGH